MKKAVLALTIAALPFAASAEVVLYGQIKSSITTGQVKIKGGEGVEKSATSTTINDNTSRIGFKGSEKLSDDLKLIWQVEQRTSILGEANSQRFGNRDSFIGLEGNFGKVRVGNMNNFINEMDTIDPWLYRSQASLGLGIYTRTGIRTTSVRYDSPSAGGFKVSASYAPRDNRNTADRYIHSTPSREQYTAALIYGKDGFNANLAYGHYKGAYTDNSGKTKAAQIAKLESYYDKNNLFVGVGAQYAKGFENGNTYLAYFTDGFNNYRGSSIVADSGKTEAVKVADANITLGYTFGNITPRISYVHGWPAKGVNSGEKLVDKFDQVVVGGEYKFSKRTLMRAQLGYLKLGSKTRLTPTQTGSVEQRTALLGMVHKF